MFNLLTQVLLTLWIIPWFAPGPNAAFFVMNPDADAKLITVAGSQFTVEGRSIIKLTGDNPGFIPVEGERVVAWSTVEGATFEAERPEIATFTIPVADINAGVVIINPGLKEDLIHLTYDEIYVDFTLPPHTGTTFLIKEVFGSVGQTLRVDVTQPTVVATATPGVEHQWHSLPAFIDHGANPLAAPGGGDASSSGPH